MRIHADPSSVTDPQPIFIGLVPCSEITSVPRPNIFKKSKVYNGFSSLLLLEDDKVHENLPV
jgi:hypothetical protein